MQDAPSIIPAEAGIQRFGSGCAGLGIMAQGDALCLASGLLDNFEDVLGQTMHGRGRVSLGISFLLTTGKRTLGPSDRVSIIVLDRLRIVEFLPFLVAVTRAQFAELSLAFMSVQRSVAFLIVQYPPELEAWIGDGKSNPFSARHVLRLVELRMFIPIEHRPYGISPIKWLALQFLRFFNRTFNHCPWIAGIANQVQFCGRLSPMETLECPEIPRLRNGSFRNDHDPRGRPADRGFTACGPRGAALAAHRPAAEGRSPSKATRKSSAVGTPPKRP